MGALSLLALLLLAMAGYGAGATLGGSPRPSLSDLLVTVALLASASSVRGVLGRWTAIAAVVPVAVGLGWLLAQTGRARRKELDRRDPRSDATEGGQRRAWRRWTAFALRMGEFQSRLVLGLFYFLVTPPFALLARVVVDPLQLRPRAGSRWRPWEGGRGAGEGDDLETAKRQF